MAEAESVQQIATWMGMAESVVFVSVVLPAAFRRPAFQVGMRAATLSTIACSSARRRAVGASGTPRRLDVGKFCSRPGNACKTTPMASSEHAIGVIDRAFGHIGLKTLFTLPRI